ncbi:UbiA prenyltransferase family-domain-containing protein [Boletus edulis]|uniref:UbiA prenyltransferase family-domain-containing protein n=1 Tax=Boletus edulis BED1 TaxID=1328754 RepID=A0AAD4GGW7_BOLED|nr:UbiA prenyltransferase family-domain-containing protein [Boletus edulis]KAF8444109.1 UbiA prenyltransferase family-domain-containing protein [Boletus edulis BED1]
MTVQHSRLDLSEIGYYLYTIFLFIQNDILTAIIPVILFSIASAPLCSSIQILPTTLWILLHILQFDLANQIKAPEEDRLNKPSRPLPAGRISVRDATILRWLIAPLCLAYSSLYSIQLVFSSLEMQLLTYWYNELDGDKNWLSKNAILAIMYGCTELGGTLIAGCDPSRVTETAKLAVQLTIAVFTSTVYCQDFKDVEGDRLAGRRTVPIMFPIASRLVVGLGLPIWSYLLCCIWDIDWLCTLAFVAYGCFVGGRFLCLRTRDADKRSCKYYSVWFSLHHLLPGYWNYFHDNDDVRVGELLQKTWDLFSGTSLLKAF